MFHCYVIFGIIIICLIVQEMIEQYVHWNEDIGEWQLKCVAYTGNNMRKQTPMPDKDKEKVHAEKNYLFFSGIHTTPCLSVFFGQAGIILEIMS